MYYRERVREVSDKTKLSNFRSNHRKNIDQIFDGYKISHIYKKMVYNESMYFIFVILCFDKDKSV